MDDFTERKRKKPAPVTVNIVQWTEAKTTSINGLFYSFFKKSRGQELAPLFLSTARLLPVATRASRLKSILVIMIASKNDFLNLATGFSALRFGCWNEV